jgi:hypothetical protein
MIIFTKIQRPDISCASETLKADAHYLHKNPDIPIGLLPHMSTPSPKRTPTDRQPRLTVAPPLPGGSVRTLSAELLALNRRWAAPLFETSICSYSTCQTPAVPQPHIAPCFNEYHLSGEDATLKNKLDNAAILQYLQRSAFADEATSEFRKLSDIISPSLQTPFKFILPPPLAALNASYLHVSLSNISVHGSALVLSYYHGSLFLYELKTRKVVSEAVYFTHTRGTTTLDQTSGEEIYFEVRDTKAQVVLMIVLMHSEAARLDTFIQAATTSPTPKDDRSKPGIPFAYSYMSPFADAGARVDPWTVWTDSHLFASPGKLSADRAAISLIGKVGTQFIPFESLPPVSLTVDTDRHLGLLAMSLPQRTFFPTSVVSLSQVKF